MHRVGPFWIRRALRTRGKGRLGSDTAGSIPRVQTGAFSALPLYPAKSRSTGFAPLLVIEPGTEASCSGVTGR
jgi:hypothetical protein